MPPGGKRRHTIRALRRRLDELAAEERERKKPPPPPISEEHAALRQRIDEANRDFVRRFGPFQEAFKRWMEMESSELIQFVNATLRIQDLYYQERDLLKAHGVVDWRPYQPE